MSARFWQTWVFPGLRDRIFTAVRIPRLPKAGRWWGAAVMGAVNRTTCMWATSLNDLDRFHLVMDAIDRVPRTGEKGIYLKQQLKDKLIEHKQYIDKYGEDLPEIRNWKWSSTNVRKPA